MDIGTIITKYCDEHGMSSTEFANRVGVSRAYIYMLKRVEFAYCHLNLSSFNFI